MKRFASVDFMRGLAIFLMLVLHIIMHSIDIDTLTADMSGLSLMEFVLMLILPFAGGLAGLFLMVSAIGNTVSMEHALDRGENAGLLARRQLIGGFILLFFAMLVEGLIGYHGDLGLWIHRSLMAASGASDAPASWAWDHSLWRFNHFETIHTIAWCIIINGVIHSYLSASEKFRDKNKLIRVYIYLALLVLLLTPLVWSFSNLLIPGFPAQEGTYMASYPRIGQDPFGRFVLVFFLQPLAGHPEPLFPYLSVSFIGSIFGVFITMPREQRDHRSFIRSVLRIGIIAYLIGLVGVLFNVIYVLTHSGFDAGLNLYMNIWDHRGWTSDILGAPFLGWYFQFLLLNGFTMLLVVSMIRLVELRGRAKKFAARTRYIRRFGFVAFTNYTIQYLYFVAMFLAFYGCFGVPYQRNTGLWEHTLLSIVIALSLYSILLYLWEKIRFAGSIEWLIKQCNYFLNPVRRKQLKKRAVPWYKAGLLNVGGVLYNADWINLREADEIDHRYGEESALARKLAAVGFVFPPYAITALIIIVRARNKEAASPLYRRALILSIVSTVFFLLWSLLFLILTPAKLGLTL